MKRRTLHYVSAFIILGVYGGQVCPFLDSLTVLQLVIPIFVTMGLLYLVQVTFLNGIAERTSLKHQSRRVFQLELGSFITAGTIVMIFNTVYYHFPLSSGLKVVLGLCLMGFFAAIDLSLEKEWLLNKKFEATGERIEPDLIFFSHPKKLVFFSSMSMFLTAGVIFLVINKDLDWMATVGRDIPVKTAQRYILTEIAFVVGVILLYMFNVIYSYSRNFRNFLSHETVVLQKATTGNFEAFVPVSSNDEFGVMAKHTNLMVEGLKKSTEELQQTRDITILSLASLAETRDNETGNHIIRTQLYVRALAVHLQEHPDFKDYLSDDIVELLHKSAPLHDIGKVGIPDHILLKPGKLSEDEFEIMKSHTTLGGSSLEIAADRLGTNSFLNLAREIALTHHERWDGKGYPLGIKGDDIPISGRLMAVADVYDALISKRVYKEAFSHDKACRIITEWQGVNFDPRMVKAFFAIEDQFLEIAGEFQDNTT
ncbi:MAG: HD domain-containing protein [Deltaproteobacteria bacterium]|nr:HD domain-containing protein [Deltaproteobacteria bacterium]MBT4641645.1 HD domain-containing protein [Deltaproteobacteria bacterium]MBT6502069.1 HD domain-containing protein [Deltaproteobacteria bacterium]MBT7151531.1 HD domain-containing protein [Deltaproteobacteria bacterium]MBT7713642.1 HD domain-containing protein [Deltaproteobacteria bacterium]